MLDLILHFLSEKRLVIVFMGKVIIILVPCSTENIVLKVSLMANSKQQNY